MPENHAGDYDEGLRDGRLAALERRVDTHDMVRNNHERRLIYLERIVWGVFGVMFLSTIWPRLEVMFSAVSK
jgi:hypothetical protein